VSKLARLVPGGNLFYSSLLLQQAALESFKRRNWIYKLFKSTPIKRAERTFASDACELWESAAVVPLVIKSWGGRG
jgi:hypothetical protein